MNSVTFWDYPYEIEYLPFPFEMIKNGEAVNMTPKNLSGYEGLYID